MRNDFESNYLAHHGILGQKWGDRNGPPYPLGAKMHSAAEKAAGWMKSLAKQHEANVKKRKRKKNLVKARKAKEAKAKIEAKKKAYEDEKAKVLRSGKASEVLKYKGDLDNSQLKDAINRIKWEKELKDLSDKEIKTNWDKMDELNDKAKKVTGYIDTGLDAYDTIEKAIKKFKGKDEEETKAAKEQKRKDVQDRIDKVVLSGDKKLIRKYAPLMNASQIENALKKVDQLEKLNGDNSSKKSSDNSKSKGSSDKENKESSKKSADDDYVSLKEILSEMIYPMEEWEANQAKKQKAIDEFYDGPEWPEDDDKKKKRK